MANTNNIDILVDNQFHLDYETAESLGLKLTKKVQDMNDLTKRFGEFSYSFSVPRTKANSKIFGHAEARGKQKIFIGQKHDCMIFNNDKLLINGILELVGLSTKSYQVVVHSMLNDFIDAAGDLELRDITTLPPILNFNYEKTIVDWINADYQNSDEAVLQFPLVFYNTVFCPTSVFTGKTDNRGVAIYRDDVYDCNYYIFNTIYSGKYNEFYYHQFPPALYLVRILEGCVNTVNWQIGGSWIQREEIKRIVFPFVGDSDIYDSAGVTGNTPTLYPERFLPEGMKIVEFLSGVINAFNLYFVIDSENKAIILETWDTMFGTQENPYNLDKLIDASTVEHEKPDNANPSIKFKDIKKDNADESKGEFVMGDNRVLKNNSDVANSLTWQKCNNKQVSGFFNYLGTDDDIDLEFGTPRVKRCLLWNDYNISNVNASHGAQTIFLPTISKQHVADNNGKNFNKKDSDTKIYNTEDTIQYKGEYTMYYYYGRSNADTDSQYLYITLATGNTFVKKYTKIGFCSPFQLTTHRTNINYYLNNLNSSSVNERDILTCTYLQSLYTMFKRSDNNIPVTPYSLVYDSDDTYHKTLYTVYYKKYMERMQNSVILSATILMDENDWQEISINRPLIYNDEIYHLIELIFNPIKRTGEIKMIKDIN